MGNPNPKVIPMPQENECTALLGSDNQVTGYLTRRRQNRLGVHWVATFQDGLAWMARQENMTGEQWRVFAYLVSRLDFDNFLKIAQKDIAEELKMNVKAVSRAMRGLRELDIITVGPMAGHSKTYRLNPRIAHRGAKNYKENIIQYDALKKAQWKKQDEAGEENNND
jgi:DNA-directed RNA polymerase specialized sigma54-like protein